MTIYLSSRYTRPCRHTVHRRLQTPATTPTRDTLPQCRETTWTAWPTWDSLDEGDFEESDEELEADSALSSAWSCVDCSEGGDIKFNFGMHKGQTYMDCLRETPRLLPLGFVREEPEPTARGSPEVGVQELRRATCWRGQTGSEGPPCRRQGLRPRTWHGLLSFREERLVRSKLSMMKQADEPCRGGCPERAISSGKQRTRDEDHVLVICGHKTSVLRPKSDANESDA